MLEFGTYGYIAKQDLDRANKLQDIDYGAAILFAHQSVEKILKHYLNNYYFNPDVKGLLQIHKLKILYKRIQELNLDEYEVELQSLSDYYFDGRYPGLGFYEPDKEETIKLVEVANIVFEKVINLLNKKEKEIVKTKNFKIN